MAEQTDPRMQRAIDVIIRMQRAENPAAIEAFMPYIRKDAALLLEAIDGPAPDWADLREMARNAGWGREGGRHWSAWGPLDGGLIDQDRGWVTVRRQRGLRVLDFHGPAGELRDHPTRSATLADPTPAEVLTAARLVGLIGGTS